MQTIDDLQFPPSFMPVRRVKIKEETTLPNGVVLRPPVEVDLSHDGIFAVVEVQGETYKF
jgi:hypothetical protein